MSQRYTGEGAILYQSVASHVADTFCDTFVARSGAWTG